MELKELYRFQGGNSYPSFNINGDQTKFTKPNDYVYFSKSINHHKYFVHKRLKQLAGKIVLEERGYNFTTRDLRNLETFKRIRKTIATSPKIEGLESLSLCVDPSFLELIESNFIYNDSKEKGSRVIERVDRKVYGGGYGISPEWLKLMDYLTIVYTRKEITREELIFLLSNIKAGYLSKIECVSFINDNRQMKLNEEVFSSYVRFKIVEALEDIMDKGLYNPESELGKHPREKIKEISKGFITVRDKTLFELTKK